ncbi:hypothetical protein PAJL_172 [Cutibacterium acnes HL042PA3]|nr:hypothetical protein TIIST44_08265 [Cutibacterium acnes subsp. defendens ATCC 11828]ALD69806.1 hypothetical protein RN83_06735 [Cutibacterium acnes]ESK59594.1 hypothetical protein PAJL_172 [Cutibacterium acnes HL042PA3]KFC13773.1 hypothetical protein PAST2_08602 [Cutibacterium acnes HL202PA1]OFJ81224.1 hypothetical protein HMPREF2841_09165 [Propionibacterium sp. HMSC065F07]OFP49997.1 hypothetical protein HMPREF2982_07785 [Propionibacterium sp. HMSC067A01]
MGVLDTHTQPLLGPQNAFQLVCDVDRTPLELLIVPILIQRQTEVVLRLRGDAKLATQAVLEAMYENGGSVVPAGIGIGDLVSPPRQSTRITSIDATNDFTFAAQQLSAEPHVLNTKISALNVIDVQTCKPRNSGDNLGPVSRIEAVDRRTRPICNHTDEDPGPPLKTNVNGLVVGSVSSRVYAMAPISACGVWAV